MYYFSVADINIAQLLQFKVCSITMGCLQLEYYFFTTKACAPHLGKTLEFLMFLFSNKSFSKFLCSWPDPGFKITEYLVISRPPPPSVYVEPTQKKPRSG